LEEGIQAAYQQRINTKQNQFFLQKTEYINHGGWKEQIVRGAGVLT
jgi:hypothetical protein